MRKVGIVTFHRALNYGALLQAYALEKTLEKIAPNDTKVEVVDYRCEFLEANRKIKTRINKNLMKSIVRCIALLRKRAQFDAFRKANIIESKSSFNKNSIAYANEQYDLFVAGSDQIWNYDLTNSDDTYFLDFVKSSEQKASYAASFGKRSLNGREQKEFESLLHSFNQVSVREKTGKDIIKGILPNMPVKIHLDPTLLLTGKDWEMVMNKKTNISGSKYILVYNVPKPDKLFEAAQILAKTTGYEVKYITTGVRPKTNPKNLCFPNVSEFLRLFHDAEYVITNSFHGTVFSILFERPMLVDLCHDGKRNERIETLINCCGLEDRELIEVSNEEVAKIKNFIDWKEVFEKLEEQRAHSKQYLSELLSNREI